MLLHMATIVATEEIILTHKIMFTLVITISYKGTLNTSNIMCMFFVNTDNFRDKQLQFFNSFKYLGSQQNSNG